jgi:hypothetical protein
MPESVSGFCLRFCLRKEAAPAKTRARDFSQLQETI